MKARSISIGTMAGKEIWDVNGSDRTVILRFRRRSTGRRNKPAHALAHRLLSKARPLCAVRRSCRLPHPLGKAGGKHPIDRRSAIER